MTEVGLELPPVSPVEVVGESGGGSLEDVSVMRDKEKVRSRDCARFCKDLGLVATCSLSLASNSESEPLLMASSECLVRWGIPDPIGGIGGQ